MIQRKIKKIAYLSGTRADFGIVTPLLKKVVVHPQFKLDLFVTGMHFMPEFGNSFKLVQREFSHFKKIKLVFNSNKQEASLAFAGKLTIALTKYFSKSKPDFALVHGDRIEMLVMAVVATYFRIPILHTQGGDLSKTVDNIVRHAITKLAHFHFPATIQAKQILLQLGEEKWRIKKVGTLALDTIVHQALMSKVETLRFLNLAEDKDYFLLLLHPISEDHNVAGKQMKIVLKAIADFKMPLIIIYPNADPGSRKIIIEIEKQKNKPLVKIYRNLDYHTFLSLEKHARVWLGNSSAGIVDSPFFKTPVINIGSRQKKRLKSANIIDTNYDEKQIKKAIKVCLFNKNFLLKVKKTLNPWGDGNSSEQIIKILEKLEINDKLLNK